MQLALLALVGFVSSTLTATIGIGGGVLLISVLPGMLPLPALVPVHGIAQLASNASRAALALRWIDRGATAVYAAGAVLGAAAGAWLVPWVPVERLPLLLGGFVLVVTWLPVLRPLPRIPGDFFALGLVQTAISLFVGAAGPLAAPVLLERRLSRDGTVATHAALMTVMHALKATAFAGLGFAFAAWWRELVVLTVAVSIGSWAGTRLRVFVPERRFRGVFRAVVTLLALRMILGVGL